MSPADPGSSSRSRRLPAPRTAAIVVLGVVSVACVVAFLAVLRDDTSTQASRGVQNGKSQIQVPTANLGTGRRGPGNQVYWGAQIGEQLTGDEAPWDMNAVSAFERLAGKPLSLISFAAPFATCAGAKCTENPFPSTPLENVRAYGAIPFFSWSSASSPPSVDQPDFQLADVVAGRFDPYIREFASSAAEWGHPFFLRFNWEMNGFWFPWAEAANDNRPGEYVQAWRHVHDIFTEAGADNVSWVWCPNVDLNGKLQDLDEVYPGDSYVDWTCLDGFNFGQRRGSPGWLDFNQIFSTTYRRVTEEIAPDKPMILGETASTDRGGDKAQWIEQTLSTLANRYPKIRAFIWFDVVDRDLNFPLELARESVSAFRDGIRRSVFVTNQFGGVADEPIVPAGAP